MHRSEERLEERCAACGADVLPETDRVFAFGEENLLCYACASARGGVYDEVEDRWVRAPQLRDLDAGEETARIRI